MMKATPLIFLACTALAGVALAVDGPAMAPLAAAGDDYGSAAAPMMGAGGTEAPTDSVQASYNPTLDTPIAGASAPSLANPGEPVVARAPAALTATPSSPVSAGAPPTQAQPAGEAMTPMSMGLAPAPLPAQPAVGMAPGPSMTSMSTGLAPAPVAERASAGGMAPVAAVEAAPPAYKASAPKAATPAQAPMPYATSAMLASAPLIMTASSLAPAPQPYGAFGAVPAPAPATPYGAFGAVPAPAPATPYGAFGAVPAPAPATPYGAFGAVPAPAPATPYGAFGAVPAPAPAMPYSAFGAVPAPAPATLERFALRVPAAAPAPAPLAALREAMSGVPLIRPVQPAPAMAPAAPPACESTPYCQLFAEDMMCCAQDGILTSATHAYVWALCTNPVDLSGGVLQVEGPANVTTFGVFNGPGKQYNYRFIVDWSNEPRYAGPISIRASPDETLNISPCVSNTGLVLTSSPLPKPLTFRALPREDFVDSYVSCPADTTIDTLDSWVWQEQDDALATESRNAAPCQQQNTGALTADFFLGGWANFDEGFQNSCNTTANMVNLERLGAILAPAPGPAQPAMLVARRQVTPDGGVAYAG